MSMDYSGFETLVTQFKSLQKEHEKFIRSFLLKEGMRLMRETKKLTPVDTGNLRNRWELSDVFRRGDELFIVLTNPVEYASFVEDGHMQRRRFVPGTWEGGKFVYDKSHETGKGMMLKDKWIPGKHMARISLVKIETTLPARYQNAFKQFVKGLGADT